MTHLDETQLDRAFRAARELTEIRELTEYPSRTSELLRQVIPCDHAGYNVIDIPSGSATVVASPADVVFDGGPEVLAQFANQSPVILRARDGDIDAMRLSDHISQSNLHRTDLYNHVYRLVGLEYQLVMQLVPLRRSLGRPHEVVGVSLARSQNDFNEDEQRLLRELRPFLANTLERLHDLAFLRAIGDDVRASGRLALLVDSGSLVAWATEAAEEALHLTVGDAVPDRLRLWLDDERNHSRSGDGSGSLIVNGRPHHVRLIVDAYPQLDAIHLTPVRAPTDPAALRSLGLTRRQADVLALALEGQNSVRIGNRLGLSPRTIERHFEGIYARLGVHNRSQAILAVLGSDALRLDRLDVVEG